MAKGSRGGRGGKARRGGLAKTFNGERQNLISQRNAKTAEVDQTLNVLRDMYHEYGIAIDTYTTSDVEPGVLGFMLGDNTITLNNAFFDSAKMTKAMQDSAKDGFHPDIGNKSGIEAVTSHEFGHILNNFAASKMGTDIDSAAKIINEEARRLSGDRGVVMMAKKISGYATYSNAETIAEAVADCYCNGNNAKVQSKAIKQVLQKYLS